MAIAWIHDRERDAGFRSLSFAFKQRDLNDIDVLSLVKVWIPWAVFLLLLTISQSILLYADKTYHDSLNELIVAADGKSIYWKCPPRQDTDATSDIFRRASSIFTVKSHG